VAAQEMPRTLTASNEKEKKAVLMLALHNPALVLSKSKSTSYQMTKKTMANA
jgi:hypothetical protein